MRIHPGRAALAAVALAEVGAVAGALVAWLFLVGAALVRDWPPPPGTAVPPHVVRDVLIGAAVWAGLAGAPVGAVAAPLLGFTLLRRVPLGRALVGPALGALLGLAAGALLGAWLSPGPAVLPLSALVPALAAAGLLLGAGASWSATRRRAGVPVDAPNGTLHLSGTLGEDDAAPRSVVGRHIRALTARK